MYTGFQRMKSIAFTLAFAGGLMIPAAAADHSRSDTRSRDNQNNSFEVSKSMVRQAQEQLKNRGFYKGPVDGINGNETRAAVQKFQRSENIVETGDLNDATLKSLGVVTAQRQSSGEASRSVDDADQSRSSEKVSSDLVRDAQRQLKQDRKSVV